MKCKVEHWVQQGARTNSDLACICWPFQRPLSEQGDWGGVFAPQFRSEFLKSRQRRAFPISLSPSSQALLFRRPFKDPWCFAPASVLTSAEVRSALILQRTCHCPSCRAHAWGSYRKESFWVWRWADPGVLGPSLYSLCSHRLSSLCILLPWCHRDVFQVTICCLLLLLRSRTPWFEDHEQSFLLSRLSFSFVSLHFVVIVEYIGE